VAANAAAVFDVLQGQQRFADDFMRRFPFAGRHAADAAGVASDIILIEKVPSAHDRPAVEHFLVSSQHMERSIRESEGKKANP
jgi:hypothetical protein